MMTGWVTKSKTTLIWWVDWSHDQSPARIWWVDGKQDQRRARIWLIGWETRSKTSKQDMDMSRSLPHAARVEQVQPAVQLGSLCSVWEQNWKFIVLRRTTKFTCWKSRPWESLDQGECTWQALDWQTGPADILCSTRALEAPGKIWEIDKLTGWPTYRYRADDSRHLGYKSTIPHNL